MPGKPSVLPKMLVAAGHKTAAELRQLFGEGVTVLAAYTYEDGARLFDREHPQVVMVGYHFDLGRPYRLVRHVRGKATPREVPIVLVRLRSSDTGTTTEEQVREGYESLGVQAFFSVPSGLARPARRKALEKLRERVFDLLRL